MIVCHCEVVSDRDVASAVREGANSVAEVCRRTGAGRNCGTCIFSVKQLVCEHGVEFAPSAALMEVERAAS